jgi:hypothetical protein
MSERDLERLIQEQVARDVAKAESEADTSGLLRADELIPPQPTPAPDNVRVTRTEETTPVVQPSEPTPRSQSILGLDSAPAPSSPAAEAAPAPEATPPTPERSRTKELLDQAWIAASAARLKLKNALVVSNARPKDEKLRAKVVETQQELKQAEAEYQGIRVEDFVAKLDAIDNERMKNSDNRVLRMIEQGVQTGRNIHRRLGETKLIETTVKLKGKDRKIAINGRMLLNAALLGGGVLAAGTGAPVLAVSFDTARRGISAAAGAYGTYDLIEMKRDKENRAGSEKVLASADNSEDIYWEMQKMRARLGLQGKNFTEIKTDNSYVRLENRYKELLENEIENVAPAAGNRDQAVAEFYANKKSRAEAMLDEAIKREKTRRTISKALAGAAGVGIATGAVGRTARKGFRLLGKSIGWVWDQAGLGNSSIEAPNMTHGSAVDVNLKAPAIDINQIKPPASPDLSDTIGSKEPLSNLKNPLTGETPSSPTSSLPHRSMDDVLSKKIPFVETEKPQFSMDVPDKEFIREDIAKIDKAITNMVDKDVVISATSRGLEGDLLHLKDSNPERYSAMIKWLQGQEFNKGVTNEGALVHRFMLNYAENHEMEVDTGRSNDLSRIFGGKLTVGSDGHIGVGVEEKDFMPEKGPELTTKMTAEVPAEPKVPTETPEIQKSIDAQARLDKLLERPIEELPYEHSPVHFEVPAHVDTGPNVAELGMRGFERTSDALHFLLGDESKSFLKETYHMSPTNLNRIAKKTISQFIAEYESGNTRFKKDFKGLWDILAPQKNKIIGSKTIRQIILDGAMKYKEALELPRAA